MSQRDLQHFLKLARAQVHHRLTKLESAAPSESSQPDPKKIWSLRTLEELIKEQIQDEDSSSSTRAPR